MSFHVPEKFRIQGNGPMCSDASYGNNGVFVIPYAISRVTLKCIASDGNGWEHVSVSLIKRCPTWEEMCFIKGAFWDEEDAVVQYHPPKSEYVNNYPFCLHLWRPINLSMPMPASLMVGYKDKDVASSSLLRLAFSRFGRVEKGK